VMTVLSSGAGVAAAEGVVGTPVNATVTASALGADGDSAFADETLLSSSVMVNGPEHGQTTTSLAIMTIASGGRFSIHEQG
jgi:hypothetical protein